MGNQQVLPNLWPSKTPGAARKPRAPERGLPKLSFPGIGRQKKKKKSFPRIVTRIRPAGRPEWAQTKILAVYKGDGLMGWDGMGWEEYLPWGIGRP